jgi:hypothetical protein
MTNTQTLERNPSGLPRPGGPAHERLDVFVGKWQLEGLQLEGPMGPASEIDAVETYEWLPGGYFLIHRINGTLGKRELACIEIIGYDPRRQVYTLHSFYVDGNSNQWEASVRDRTWTYTGTWTNSEPMQVRCVQEFNEAGNASMGKWEFSTDGRRWQTFWDVRNIKLD